jgi:hypothetical protein
LTSTGIVAPRAAQIRTAERHSGVTRTLWVPGCPKRKACRGCRDHTSLPPTSHRYSTSPRHVVDALATSVAG